MKLTLLAGLMLIGAVSQDSTCSADGSCEEASVTMEWMDGGEDMGAEISKRIETLAEKHGISNPKYEIIGVDDSEVAIFDLNDKTHYPITIKIMKPVEEHDASLEQAEQLRLAKEKAEEELRVQVEQQRKSDEEAEKATAEKKRLEEETQEAQVRKQELPKAIEIHNLKWRWAENLFIVPVLGTPIFTPRLPVEDVWNVVESRMEVKSGIEEKLKDVMASKLKYDRRKVEVADIVTDKRRTFDNYHYLFEWLQLEANVV